MRFDELPKKKLLELSCEGMVLMDKPAGMSSFGVVARVRRRLSEAASVGSSGNGDLGGFVNGSGRRKKVKVGHTGTLDPFATGLLILLTGKATRKAGEFLKLDKMYEATLRLGAVSTTGDPEGEIEAVENKKTPTVDEVEAVMKKFTGKIQQRPPQFSAIKIQGRRAYELARKGVKVEMPEREVEIYKMEILRYEYTELTIRVKVSSGTYVRTLAEDMGRDLGCGAYLTALRRISIGEYKVENAMEIG